MANGCHYLVEQPQGSELFLEDEYRQLEPHCFRVVFDQCMVGLKMKRPPYRHVRKTTECRASHPSLLVHLQDLRCPGKHPHAHIGSWSNDGHPTVRSSDMQVWPVELCERIAAGVVECVVQMHESQHRSGRQAYPTVSSSRAEASDEVVEVEYKCPGCRGHLRKTDTRHTRGDDCKFPEVEPESWTCPGCLRGKHRAHESHSNGPDCKWAIARSMPEGLSRERGATHPRDGRIPASRDPTADLRLVGRHDGVPGHSSSSPM